MKKYILCCVTALYVVMGTIGWAQAEIPPVPTSSIYVQDYAQVLNATTKQQINAVGQNLQQQTKAQVVVITVKTLAQTPIEEYSLAVLRNWGVGDKTLNNGAVIVVAVDDQRSRVEVGYGLEGALPDGKTGQLQDEYMLPYFKSGDYDSGVLNGYLAIAKIAAAEYKVALTGAAEPIPMTNKKTGFWADLQAIIIVIVIIGLVILDFMFFGGRLTMLIIALAGKRGGGGGGFGGGSGGGGGSSRRW